MLIKVFSRLLAVAMMCLISCPVFGTIEDDFKYFVEIFPGIYDKSFQIFEDMKNDLQPGIVHVHFTAQIFSEDISIFPKTVKTFYVQEFANNDARYTVRQGIYAFQINETTEEIVSKFYIFVNPSKFINGQGNRGLFSNATWNDFIYVPSCDVKWTRVESDLFRSAVLGKCQIIHNNVSYISAISDLSSSYLTVNEKWTYVANGSVSSSGMLFNMSKLISPTNKNIVPHIGEKKKQLNNLTDIIAALEQGLPVSLFIDLPTCHLGKVLIDYSNDSKYQDDFPVEDFSVDIDTFEFFNSTAFAAYPFLGFSYYPIVRTSQGDMYQLYEGKVFSMDMIITITWLNPANYKRAQQFIYGCHLRDATKGNGGQITAVSSQISVRKITNFDQLKTAIQQGYKFRFYVLYSNCAKGPDVNSSGGGIIHGMRLGYDGNSIRFTKSALISNYQGEGYVINIVSGTFSRDGFTATLVASNNYVLTFKRVYNETLVCSVSTDVIRGAVDLYYY